MKSKQHKSGKGDNKHKKIRVARFVNNNFYFMNMPIQPGSNTNSTTTTLITPNNNNPVNGLVQQQVIMNPMLRPTSHIASRSRTDHLNYQNTVLVSNQQPQSQQQQLNIDQQQNSNFTKPQNNNHLTNGVKKTKFEDQDFVLPSEERKRKGNINAFSNSPISSPTSSSLQQQSAIPLAGGRRALNKGHKRGGRRQRKPLIYSSSSSVSNDSSSVSDTDSNTTTTTSGRDEENDRNYRERETTDHSVTEPFAKYVPSAGSDDENNIIQINTISVPLPGIVLSVVPRTFDIISRGPLPSICIRSGEIEYY